MRAPLRYPCLYLFGLLIGAALPASYGQNVFDFRTTFSTETLPHPYYISVALGPNSRPGHLWFLLSEGALPSAGHAKFELIAYGAEPPGNKMPFVVGPTDDAKLMGEYERQYKIGSLELLLQYDPADYGTAKLIVSTFEGNARSTLPTSEDASRLIAELFHAGGVSLFQPQRSELPAMFLKRFRTALVTGLPFRRKLWIKELPFPGYLYIGPLTDGFPHGVGKAMVIGGFEYSGTYVGQFNSAWIDGDGTLYKTDRYITGHFRNAFPSGPARIGFSTGAYMTATLQDGIPKGNVTLHEPDGNSFSFHYRSGVAQLQLIGAELATHTRNNDKDHDTEVAVQITESSANVYEGRVVGGRILAQIGNAAAGIGYPDGSDHVIQIPASPDVAMAECSNFKYRVGITAHGNIYSILGQRFGGDDDWAFDSTVTLYFSDGSRMWKSKTGEEINSTQDRQEWEPLQ